MVVLNFKLNHMTYLMLCLNYIFLSKCNFLMLYNENRNSYMLVLRNY